MQTWRRTSLPPQGSGSAKSLSEGSGLTMSLTIGVWEVRLYFPVGQSWAETVTTVNTNGNHSNNCMNVDARNLKEKTVCTIMVILPLLQKQSKLVFGLKQSAVDKPAQGACGSSLWRQY